MKIFAISLGCAKNSIDTEQILGALAIGAGRLELADVQDGADVVLINTCGFIQSAVEESVEVILEIAGKRGQGQIVAVTGCLVQRYGQDLARELRHDVDIFHGTSDPAGLAEKILQALSDGTGKPPVPGYAAPEPVSFPGPVAAGRLVTTPPWRAYVKIAEGCSNRCSYCLIPQIRGGLRCRPVAEIVDEVNELTLHGVREITLLAQDLTAYQYMGTSLAGLAKLIVSDTDIPWLRLLYLHPAGITRELLEVMAMHGDRICPYLDIPVQHAASGILRRMGRGYSSSYLDRLFSTIRTVLPHAALRTTVMTGFPGETHDDFLQLLKFVEKWGFMHLGCFEYSDEEGIAASRLDDKVDSALAGKRREEIMELQAGISRKINAALVGSTHKVLVEGFSPETELLLQGRTMLQAPEVDGLTYIAAGTANEGDIVDVRITDAHVYDIVGEIV